MTQCKHNFIIQVGQSPESYLHKRDLPYTNGSECIMIWIFCVWQTLALLTSWSYYSIAKQRNIFYVHYAVLQNVHITFLSYMICDRMKQTRWQRIPQTIAENGTKYNNVVLCVLFVMFRKKNELVT